MISTTKFDELLGAVGTMSLEEQTEFVGVLQRRLTELRREEIIAEIAESQKEFEAGLATATTAASSPSWPMAARVLSSRSLAKIHCIVTLLC